MRGRKRLILVCLAISAAASLANAACGGRQQNVAQSENMTVLKADEGEPSCGSLLDDFQMTLSSANRCTVASDCDFFEVGAGGCWLLFNKSKRDELSALQSRVMAPRCRVFLPMYKCTAKPGDVNCNAGRCVWQKGAVSGGLQ